jgi:hypothetical protein
LEFSHPKKVVAVERAAVKAVVAARDLAVVDRHREKNHPRSNKKARKVENRARL